MAEHPSIVASASQPPVSEVQTRPIAAEDFQVLSEENLEADSADNDSAYGESTKSSYLTSIASEVTRGVQENGRRYHSFGSGEYGFPNDDRESDRLDMQHAMMTLMLGERLFWSPIDPNPSRILDIGTGTGIWCIDAAEMLESAEVVGFDLSPIQPTWVPPNCKFEIDDAERDWTYTKDSFDLIHARNLVCAIRDWPKLIRQSYEHVKPGGWVEFQNKHPDMCSDDRTLAPDSALRQWTKHFFDGCERFGTSMEFNPLMKQRFIDAGFVDVQEYVLKLPIGPWPRNKQLKKIGAFEMINMTEGIEAVTLRLFSKALGMSVEEVQLLLVDVRKEAKDPKIHSYYTFWVVMGRKPRVGEVVTP